MKNHTRKQELATKREFQEAIVTRDALENAVLGSSALLEAFSVLLKASENSEYSLLADASVEGLQRLAMDQGNRLREAYRTYTDRLQKSLAVAA